MGTRRVQLSEEPVRDGPPEVEDVRQRRRELGADVAEVVVRAVLVQRGGDDAGDGGALRYGAHTDYQTFTVLRADPEVGGLQVQLADGRWLNAPREADAPARDGDEPLLFVNAGDLTARWTNGRWRSAPHRVVNTEIARARRSLVFFTGPDDDAEISPIVAAGDTARFAPITAGAHLRAKLGISNV